jgi:hypothetical protein
MELIVTTIAPLSSIPTEHTRCECVLQTGTTRLLNEARNALQRLANCAYLVAIDSGVSAENRLHLAQMQSDVATMSILLKRLTQDSQDELRLNDISRRRSS